MTTPGTFVDVNLRKSKFIGDGEKGVGQVYDHFLFAYENDYQIPNTPPDVDKDFSFSPGAQNVITWPGFDNSAINPDYGTADITSYRIYTSDFDEEGAIAYSARSMPTARARIRTRIPSPSPGSVITTPYAP